MYPAYIKLIEIKITLFYLLMRKFVQYLYIDYWNIFHLNGLMIIWEYVYTLLREHFHFTKQKHLKKFVTGVSSIIYAGHSVRERIFKVMSATWEMSVVDVEYVHLNKGYITSYPQFLWNLLLATPLLYPTQNVISETSRVEYV